MTEQPKIQVQYHPQVFDAGDMQRAKEIILTSEGPGADTDRRWQIETPYVIELMSKCFILRPDTVVLDYGCGIGRVAKAMIEAFGCSVIGVDISRNMRRLAEDYVDSERFVAVAPQQFDTMVRAGLRIQAAIAIWVLQHCLTPAEDIARIKRGVLPNGRVFVLNMPKRAVPAKVRENNQFVWIPDNVDVSALLRSAFTVQAEGAPDKSRTPNMADVGAYWMDLRRPAQ
jgi:ubiquinone/menaquinone biosynthesis C-methylase UbiE